MVFGTRSLAACALAAALVGSASADVILSQPDFSDFGFYSLSAPGDGISERQAESFVLSQTMVLTSAGWWGYSDNFTVSDLSNQSAWRIQIFDGTASAVGGSVFDGSVAIGNTGATDTGSTSIVGSPIYQQSVGLPAVQLGPGTYWISISADFIDDQGSYWNWSITSSTYDNTSAWEENVNSGTWHVTFDDFAIQLEGRPVPEPASWLALGGLALLAVKRRK